MAISDADFEAATRRGQEVRASNPAAKSVTYDRRKRVVVISFSNGMSLTIPPASVEELADAPASALASVEIEGGGLSLHWPEIDVDLFLPALLQGATGSRAWMAAQLGKKGGAAKSEAKIAASRRNGQRGGRPRKDAKPAAQAPVRPVIEPPKPRSEPGRSAGMGLRFKSATTVHATKQEAMAAAKKIARSMTGELAPPQSPRLVRRRRRRREKARRNARLQAAFLSRPIRGADGFG